MSQRRKRYLVKRGTRLAKRRPPRGDRPAGARRHRFRGAATLAADAVGWCQMLLRNNKTIERRARDSAQCDEIAESLQAVNHTFFLR